MGTAQEMDAMRAAAASPRPKTDPEVGSGGAGDARVAAILVEIGDSVVAPKAPNTEAACQPDNHDHCEMPVVKLGQGAYERAWPDDGTVGPLPTSNVRPVSAPEQAEIDETLDAFGIGNPQAGEGAPLAPSPAPLDRETADAFFRAGYSAAMCEAVVIVHKHFISSMARAGATIDLCEKGSNPPVPATLGPGGVK